MTAVAPCSHRTVQQLSLDGGTAILIFDGAVVETFHTSYDKSFRVPAAWLAIKAEPRKHDRIRLTVGRADPDDGRIYGPDLKLAWLQVMFEIDAAEEPGVRAFLDEVARTAGR